MSDKAPLWAVPAPLGRRLNPIVRSARRRVLGLWSPSAVPWSGPLDDEPFFIVGSGRSGTTLLRRLLVAGGEVHIPPEIFAVRPVVNDFPVIRNLGWDSVVHHVMGRYQWDAGLRRSGADLTPAVERLRDLPEERRSLAAVIDAVYAEIDRTGEGGAGGGGDADGGRPRRWADKTPRNTFHMADLQRIFPTTRFVHMVRDGYDVVASLLEAGLCRTAEESAIRWREAVEEVEAFRADRPGLVLDVRYEDLVADPARVVADVCRFVGLTFRDEMVGGEHLAPAMGDVPTMAHHANVFRPVTDSSVGKGRAGLDRADRATVAEMIGPLMAGYGYPTI